MSTFFINWLTDTLIKVDKEFDTESLVPYINDILKTEENDEERNEAISYMLSENLDEEVTQSITLSIINKFQELFGSSAKEDEEQKEESFDKKISDLMRSQAVVTETSATVSSNSDTLTAEDKERKAAILAQYASVEADLSNDDDEDSVDLQVSANVNSKKIDDAEKMKREKMKIDHETNKVRNKENAEKQAQKVKDRKEKVKEKTQKGERRR